MTDIKAPVMAMIIVCLALVWAEMQVRREMTTRFGLVMLIYITLFALLTWLYAGE